MSWDEAYGAAAEKIRAARPERFAVYVTSRGILNEHYYAAQKAARAMGTNHVDNSARLCHAASTVAMKRTLGYGATTCSYTDWIGSGEPGQTCDRAHPGVSHPFRRLVPSFQGLAFTRA